MFDVVAQFAAAFPAAGVLESLCKMLGICK